ncbi:MAG: F0F1 ATP synthase subunit epsilon [Clostridia bacterium]|nr:F0F1 ATP synthase subunit epsilon [Clostridia bacterium]
MDEFSLQVCTPEGITFDGKITSVTARSTVGDICIMNGHANYMTTIENGKLLIKTKNDEITARCSGGFISVNDNKVRIFVNSFDKT